MAKDNVPEIKTAPVKPLEQVKAEAGVAPAKQPEMPPEVHKQIEDKVASVLAATPGAKMISVPAEEWELMKATLAKLAVAQQKTTEAIAAVAPAKLQNVNVEHIEVENKEPVKEGAVRKKFLVDLPYCKPRVMLIDVVPGAEFASRDQAIKAYDKHFGILNSIHQHEVQALEVAQEGGE